MAQPITQETLPLIVALATAGWHLEKTGDAWNAMQRVPLIATLACIAHDGGVTAVAFSPDGTRLATASEDKTARIVAVPDGRELARIPHDGGVYAVAFSPDGTRLATASRMTDGHLKPTCNFHHLDGRDLQSPLPRHGTASPLQPLTGTAEASTGGGH